MLVAITVISGTALWTLQFRAPASGMQMTYVANAGLKVPAWGDPTDCVPAGYPIAPSNTWSWSEWWAYYRLCSFRQVGNFSMMNASTITITSVTPDDVPLSLVDFYFICHNTTPVAENTVLVGGSLAAMTWFPGSSTSPAPNAPHLGYCGNFDASGFGGGAFGTLYNRLGIFIPLRSGTQVLQAGDTFVLYVHTPGSVYDPLGRGGPDRDDYHGAPAWCFTDPGACEIQFIYSGEPNAVLATIPIYSISGAGQ